MALTPQIDNEVNIVTTTIEVPSKTYKLDINSDNNIYYTEDYNNIVRFMFDNHNLIELLNHPDADITFEIVDGNLMATSDNEELLNKYHIVGYDMMFDTNYYGERIMGYVDNLQAIKQAVYHILMVERYSYIIYSDNYGVELEQYIGRDFDYLAATIQDTLKDALMYDLRITDVIVTNIEKLKSDTVKVDFTVYSIYGNLQMEVNISV